MDSFRLLESSNLFLRLAEQQPSAGLLFFCPDDQTVFLTLRGPMMSSPLTWDVSGGRPEKDEDPEQTAMREATEELSHLPRFKTFLGRHEIKTDHHYYIVYCYSVSGQEKMDWNREIELDSENIRFRWFPVDQLPAATHFDLSWIPSTLQKLHAGRKIARK